MSLFATLYDPVMIPADWLGLGAWRRWAAAVPGERILEIGVGTGLNFRHYPGGNWVMALDPSAQMLTHAAARATAAESPRFYLCRGRGESLPFSGGAFDAAVGTLVFCSVEDPGRTLQELRRVLKPGAPLRLVEHVRFPNRWISRLQDWLTPSWKRVAGGCHLNRDILSLLHSSGFEVRTVRQHVGGLFISVEACEIPASGVSPSRRPRGK